MKISTNTKSNSNFVTKVTAPLSFFMDFPCFTQSKIHEKKEFFCPYNPVCWLNTVCSGAYPYTCFFSSSRKKTFSNTLTLVYGFHELLLKAMQKKCHQQVDEFLRKVLTVSFT